MKLPQVTLVVVKMEVRGEFVEVVLRALDDRPGPIPSATLVLQLKNPGDVRLWDKYSLEPDISLKFRS